VVGFDNMPESRFFNPPLTTATSDFGRLWLAKSLDILFARIRGTPEAVLRRVFPNRELVVRKSTGRAPGREGDWWFGSFFPQVLTGNRGGAFAFRRC